MASTFISVPSFRPNNNLQQARLPARGVSTRIAASVSEKQSSYPSSSITIDHATLPTKHIPGSHGIPFISHIKDRWEYFYGKGGRDEYLKSLMLKYQSTVFRANMPPGPFISKDPRVVVLLDGKSFPVLFDTSKVEKKDLFTGTYMPSTELTGGYRVLSYLDPSEPKHGQLKQLLFHLLKSSRDRILPSFNRSYSELFQNLETELAAKGKAGFNDPNDLAVFDFLSRAYFGVSPSDTPIGSDAPKLISTWVLFNVGPLLTLGLPPFIEEPLLHTFRLPPFLIKRNYQRLYDFFYSSSTLILDHAENLGISREEACHNILFTTCFNTFGGFKILFPNTLKWIGRAGAKLHTQLVAEIRSSVQSSGGKITMAAMEQMPLMKSVVYESLRIEPPVALQYGKAKENLVIESHDAKFNVKKGEMLFGYQPFATKDPKIFDRADEFVPDRFVGDGEKLLKYVCWSNGPETENPTVENKQCAGKDFVVFATRLFLVELFLRYDSFEIEVGSSPLGAKVTITSLKRARV